MSETAIPYTTTPEAEGLYEDGFDTYLVKAHENDAAYDLRAVDNCWLEAGETLSVPTGVRIALPDGYAGQVLPRSGLAKKIGLTIPNAPGLIDPGYRGEIEVLLYLTPTPGDIHAIANGGAPRNYGIAKGDRIAQLMIVKTADLAVRWEPELRFEMRESERGVRGFGSTGR